MKKLKIATLNTWNCQGELNERLALMKTGLLELEADIILLQEVFIEHSLGMNTARELADHLDMESAVVLARKKHRRHQGQDVVCFSALGLLTRGRITRNDAVRLPDDPRDGDRMGQIAEINLDGHDILLANVHLSHLKREDRLRDAQLNVLLDHLNTAQRRHDLCLLGGDLNLNAGHPILCQLANTQGFINASATLKQTQRTSLNKVNGAGSSAGIIDHLLVRSPTHSLDEITACLRLGDKDPQTGHFPSDHKALVCDIFYS